MAAAAAGIVGVGPDGLPIHPEHLFIEEIGLLDACAAGSIMVNKRLNNNYTVTGLTNVSAGDIGAICNRHGNTYTAYFEPETGYVTFKFMPIPEVAGAGAHADAAPKASLNTDNDASFEASVSRWFDCGPAEKKQERGAETVVFLFTPKNITKAKADGLLADPAVANVVLSTEGILVIFARRSDSRNSVRHTKATTPSLYYPRTAQGDWMYRASSLTAGSRRSANKHSAAARREKKESLLAAAAKWLSAS